MNLFILLDNYLIICRLFSYFLFAILSTKNK